MQMSKSAMSTVGETKVFFSNIWQNKSENTKDMFCKSKIERKKYSRLRHPPKAVWN